MNKNWSEIINGIIDKECLLISKNLIEKYY